MRFLFVNFFIGNESVSEARIRRRFRNIDFSHFFRRMEKEDFININANDANKRYKIISLHSDRRNSQNVTRYIPKLDLFVRAYLQRKDEKIRIISIIVDEEIEKIEKIVKTAGKKSPRITHDKIKIIKILLNHLYGFSGWERDILTGNIWNILPIDTFYENL